MYHQRRPRRVRLVIAACLEGIEIPGRRIHHENGARRPIVENSLREPLGPAMIDMIGIRIIRGVQRAQSSQIRSSPNPRNAIQALSAYAAATMGPDT